MNRSRLSLSSCSLLLHLWVLHSFYTDCERSGNCEVQLLDIANSWTVPNTGHLSARLCVIHWSSLPLKLHFIVTGPLSVEFTAHSLIRSVKVHQSALVLPWCRHGVATWSQNSWAVPHNGHLSANWFFTFIKVHWCFHGIIPLDRDIHGQYLTLTDWVHQHMGWCFHWHYHLIANWL